MNAANKHYIPESYISEKAKNYSALIDVICNGRYGFKRLNTFDANVLKTLIDHINGTQVLECEMLLAHKMLHMTVISGCSMQKRKGYIFGYSLCDCQT